MSNYPHHLWFWVAGQEAPADQPPRAAVEALPAKPAPQVCPEVWNTTPVSAERAMDAVRSMCGGLSHG